MKFLFNSIILLLDLELVDKKYPVSAIALISLFVPMFGLSDSVVVFDEEIDWQSWPLAF